MFGQSGAEFETYSSVFSSSSSSSSSPQAVRLSAALEGLCAFICGLFAVFLFVRSISAEPTREDLLLELQERLQTKHKTEGQAQDDGVIFSAPARYLT